MWLQSPSVVILEPRKIKSDTVSTGEGQSWVAGAGLSWACLQSLNYMLQMTRIMKAEVVLLKMFY